MKTEDQIIVFSLIILFVHLSISHININHSLIHLPLRDLEKNQNFDQLFSKSDF